MRNREFEVLILKKIKEINPKFQIIPFLDLKYKRKLTLPRVISRTNTNRIIERFTKRSEDENGKAIYLQHNVRRKVISLTFALSQKEQSSDVDEFVDYFSDLVGVDWWNDLKDLNIVIEGVTDCIDISSNNTDGLVERWSFDLIIRTQSQFKTEIEIVKEVEFENEWR